MPTSVMDCFQDSFDPPITVDALDGFERAIGIKLPADYRNFLLRYNGGYFEHWVQFRIPTPIPFIDGDYIRSMFGLFDDSNGYACDELMHNADIFDLRRVDNMLPVGHTSGNILCLSLSDDDFGSVFMWDGSMADAEQWHFVAPNIDAFFDMLWIDPDFVSHDETIPIFQAVETGDVAAVEKYLGVGGEVNQRNALGQTLLMCSAKNCWPKIAALLLSRDATVQASDKTSCDALYYAAVSGSVDITKLLLAAGAQVSTAKRARPNAIEAATEVLAFRVVELLVAAAQKQ